MEERERCAQEVAERNVSGVDLSISWNQLYELCMTVGLT